MNLLLIAHLLQLVTQMQHLMQKYLGKELNLKPTSEVALLAPLAEKVA